MGRFKGQTIQLGGPERLLPTESTGIDLREARSMNRPPRDDRYEDRGPRRMDDRGFDSGPRRTFREREDEDGPRRTTSRWADESSRAENEDDWRSGPSRTTSSTTTRRFESEPMERRASTRRAPVDEEKTAADEEDDWRAGSSAPKSSSAGFGERRVSRRDDLDDGPRRVTSRADDDDWRRGGRDTAPEERIERTRSFRPAPTRADEEGDWRTPSTSNSATPWARKGSAVSATPGRPAQPPRTKKTDDEGSPRKFETPSRKAPVVVAAEKEEDKWSSSEDEEEEIVTGPDMEKINKFAEKVNGYMAAGDAKKIDSIVKKVPVNFSAAELKSLEPMKAILALGLSETVKDEESVRTAFELIAPVLRSLEEEFGDESRFELNILEQVQVHVNTLGLPRISPEMALIELVWISLYETQIVAEEMFRQWLDDESLPGPGKSTTLFQTQAFIAWLYEEELPGVEATRRAAVSNAAAEDKDEWSDDSDSDIEALVPKRISTAGINLRPTSTGPLRR